MLVACLMMGCNGMFYYPDTRDRGRPTDHNVEYEDVFFHAEDGVRLHGWYMTAGPSARGTVLHIHGNAGNITGHYEFVHWLPSAGYNVLTFDYRGYGRSGGRITREGSICDAYAALDYLRNRPDVDRDRIVLFGQSLGGSIGAVVAAERREQVRAVAMDSAFSRYRDIVRHHVFNSPVFTVLAWWLPFTIPRGQDALESIGRIAPVPVLIMHGRDDRVAPWRMACELYEAAAEPKELWLIEKTDHMEVWMEEPETAQAKLVSFYEAALKDE
jgi:fermentation-respiration switch protein FrsA (DUF1100 family)